MYDHLNNLPSSPLQFGHPFKTIGLIKFWSIFIFWYLEWVLTNQGMMSQSLGNPNRLGSLVIFQFPLKFGAGCTFCRDPF